jgi:hypothetical protein
VKPYRLRFRDRLGHASAAYTVLLGMLLLTGLAWYGVKQNVETRERARFEETVKTIEEAIDRRMNTYVDAMLDSRGLFVATETVERHEWRNYVAGSDLERRYPGIQAVGYTERVRPEERDDHVARVREEGLASYELRPTGERYEYFSEGGYLPTLEGLYEDVEILDKVPVISSGKEAIQNVRSRPVSPFYSDMSLVMAERFNALLQGNVSPQEAATTLGEDLRKIIEKADKL